MKNVKQKTIFKSILATSVVSMLIFTLLSAFIISRIFLFQIIKESGNNRVDLLEQVNAASIMNRKIMVEFAENMEDELLELLRAGNNDARIRDIFKKDADEIRKLGLDLNMNIIMKNKTSYSTDENSRTLEQLKNTYWYIRHYSGITDESWNLFYGLEEEELIYGLSYGKTLFGEKGEVIGVLIATSMDKGFFSTFEKLTNDDTMTYILDENGIIISHNNVQQIGNWKADMESFERNYVQHNSYAIKSNRHGSYLIASYYDDGSGWTYVIEQKLSVILGNSIVILVFILFLIVAVGIFMIFINHRKIKSITKSLTNMTKEIIFMRTDKLHEIAIEDSFEELSLLCDAFNKMVRHIEELIEDIKQREKEKRRMEYDFLQAQLNPHFLNNTLVAIKSLIAIQHMEEAGNIMGKLISILNVPATPEVQLIELNEEIRLVEDYLGIMNCRTDKHIKMICDLEKNAENVMVPRMILQPIVENSVFHGFADKEENCMINIYAEVRNDILEICIRDNGEGMSTENLDKIVAEETKDDNTHHGIGINNVRRRLEVIYGETSKIRVESKEGKGTAVFININI